MASGRELMVELGVNLDHALAEVLDVAAGGFLLGKLAHLHLGVVVLQGVFDEGLVGVVGHGWAWRHPH